MSTSKGYSLIEVAIVLFVMSILMTGAVSGFVAMVKTNEFSHMRGLMDIAKGDLLLSTAKTKTCAVDCSYTVTVPVTIHKDTWGGSLEIALLGGPVIDKNTPNGDMVRIRSFGPDHALGGGDDITVIVSTAELVYLLSRSGL